MEQYIGKSALVAEIERMKVDAIQFPFEEYGTVGTCNKLLSFLNTLEVKEVDLEKKATEFVQTKEFIKNDNPVLAIAKYFFELGLKTQKKE